MRAVKFGVGQSVVRKEDDLLLRGRGRYIADSAPRGALCAVVLRSPHAHARFRIDATGARSVPGVRLVLRRNRRSRVDCEALGFRHTSKPAVTTDRRQPRRGSNATDRSLSSLGHSQPAKAMQQPTPSFLPSIWACRPSASMLCKAIPTGLSAASELAARARFRVAAHRSTVPQKNSPKISRRSRVRRSKQA